MSRIPLDEFGFRDEQAFTRSAQEYTYDWPNQLFFLKVLPEDEYWSNNVYFSLFILKVYPSAGPKKLMNLLYSFMLLNCIKTTGKVSYGTMRWDQIHSK